VVNSLKQQIVNGRFAPVEGIRPAGTKTGRPLRKYCKHCSNEMIGRGIFCSAECKKSGGNYGRNARQVAITCKYCDKVFSAPVSAKKNGRKYCSVECSHAAGTPFRAGNAGWRARSKYGKGKVDANHGEIVGAFNKLGAQVFDTSGIGGGFPDLLVCARGGSHFVEVKNAQTPYGRRGLNPAQKDFAESWQGGPVYVVYTVDDVAAFMTGDIASIPSYGGYKP